MLFRSEDFENKAFMVSSFIFAGIAFLFILNLVLLNIVISKKRHFIYTDIIKSKNMYDEGVRKLNYLASIPQTKLNFSNTLLYLAYTKMFQLKYKEALEYFDKIKKFNIGIRNIVLASYYKVLIYFYLDNKRSLESELQYFNSFRRKLNSRQFENIVMCIDAIEKNNLTIIIENLKKQTNPFVNLIIEKLG